MGGRVKIVIIGLVLLEVKVFNFIRVVFGCVVRMVVIFGDFKWLYNEKKILLLKWFFILGFFEK